MLNPNQSPFCLGGSHGSVNLPIRINQTNPILIELLRVDLDTNVNETITVTAKEISRLKRQADKEHAKNDYLSPRILRYMVKETGLYRLQKVVDESKLEVQRRMSDTLVVNCPTAMVKAAPQDKCKGALSDFHLHVDATPPLKIRYSKTVNGDDHGHVVLSIHPENLISPLARQRTSGALVSLGSAAQADVSWARAQSIDIPLNESLGVSGGWQYTIDEVQDACGNIANYSYLRTLEQSQQKSLKGRRLEQHFLVHERPRVALREYDSQHPIKVEKGKSKPLPLQLSSTGSGKAEDAPHTLYYLFTPQDDMLPDQKHSRSATLNEVVIMHPRDGPSIREPGLYSLQSISTHFCDGEVMEPSSCLLINPPEPDLSISAENIPDKCAGNSIGLLVDLDMFGTPPFHVLYNIRQKGGSVVPKVQEVDRLHTQLELKPMHAGHYIYEFTGISDAVYGDPRSLAHKKMILEQDVKPPAAARILDAKPARKACIEEPVTFAIQILGEPPFTIDYELVHRGRRQKHKITDILESIHMLTTDPLKNGGEYTLALTSITDQSGCKVFLKDEAVVDVGLQRPRAGFGHLEGKRNIQALEGRKIGLPVRLQGESPWTVTYRNGDEVQGQPLQQTLRNSNDQIEITNEGTYEIVDVHDASCPGSVDLAANSFTVRWIPRPSIQIAESLMVERIGERYVKKEVCEGDEDVTEVAFTGTAPFNVEYEQRHKPDSGSQSMSPKKFSAGLHMASLRMETSEAGIYEYKFSKLGDTSYNHDQRRFSPLIVQQRVHPRPSASFTEAGKTYRYCQEEEEEASGEVVPINLVGQPPFHLELEIKQHMNTKPEVINVPNIVSNHYKLHIPHKVLTLGTHSVTIRKVQDSRGCQRKMDFNAPHVQVSVADIPSISPLEERTNYCVGDRISYTLSGTPPFNVFYTFQDRERKAAVSSTEFRRIAEKPGVFTVTALSDQRSTDACKAKTKITKVIHEMPSVRVSKGRTATVDIHEGGEAEILFEFGGTPPFHFT
jgi:nucleoporin POM152